MNAIRYKALFLICLIAGCHSSEVSSSRPIAPNVIAVPTASSTAYILIQRDKVALINSGSNPAAAEVLQELESKGRTPQEVRAIFTTSPHDDLNAGAHVFNRALTYTGLHDHRTLRADKHPKALLPKLKARLSPRPSIANLIRNVYPGDLIQNDGFKVQVVGTPGVSRDSMMYLYEGILFTGKSLLIQDGELALAPRYQLASKSQTVQSLARLGFLEFHTVADAYGQVAAFGPQEVIQFVESLR